MSSKQLERWREFSCTLEVDLEYDQSLHDLHNDYPLAPEKMVIDGVEKLIPNLNGKKKYVVHSEILKTYLEFGLKIGKIWRGVRYTATNWMSSYIQFNTKLRTCAKNDFEKDLYKFMNNSVFGKTMENIRKRVNNKLVNSREKAEKLSCKVNYKDSIVFSKDLINVHMKKKIVYFDKPIYVGQAVLDLSKMFMYDFHYDYMMKKYSIEDCKMMYTDTDSFVYLIKTDDFYSDIEGDVDFYFDTSNLDGIDIKRVNKKVPGTMKDECGGRIISKFIGLRAKLYSYKMDCGDVKNRCTGVKKCVSKRITFEDFENVLFEKVGEKCVGMNIIRSDKHKLYSVCVNKVALSGKDDKRIIKEDGFGTYAHGHWRVLSEDMI